MAPNKCAGTVGISDDGFSGMLYREQNIFTSQKVEDRFHSCRSFWFVLFGFVCLCSVLF